MVNSQRSETELEREILQLREFGFDNHEIILQLNLEGFDVEEVELRFRSALRRSLTNPLTIHEQRSLQIHRYEYYLKSLNKRIDRGDEKAIATALKITIEKNKLLGLYTPVELKLNLLVEERVNTEIENFTSMLEADPRMTPELMDLINEISSRFVENQVQ